jgi:hypothetical protein
MVGFIRALWLRRYLVSYLALTGWFLFGLAGYHDSRTGLTSLMLFGGSFQPRRLERLRGLPIFTSAGSFGYDGQFYSQIAVTGTPFDPELRTALDAPAYRSLRILMPIVAHVAGLGHPWWVLNAYALIGIVSWLILAWVLARWWFPPVDFQNLLRWSGCLLGGGMIVSVTRSLTEGPSLLLIVFAIRALETNRRWLSAALFAAGGLVRETTILCAPALLPTTIENRRDWIRSIAETIACVAPVILWMAVLTAYLGFPLGGSTSHMVWPLAAAIRKVHVVLATARSHGFDKWVRTDWFTLVSLGVQAGFILARPRFRSPLWRIGAVFAVLGLFLGWPMWVDTPPPIARNLLPLAFAFNRLAPSGRRGVFLLALGNLSVLSAASLIQPPIFENQTFSNGITFDYGPGWFATEREGPRTWRWASGSTTLVLHNPTSRTFKVVLEATLISNTDRTITMAAHDETSSFTLKPGQPTAAAFGPFSLPPGDTPVAFRTSEPPWLESPFGGRPLAFSIEGLRAEVTPAPP